MNIQIRKWRLSDADSLVEAINNEKVQQNLRDGLPFPYTKADALEYIDYCLNADLERHFAFCIDVDGKAVGNIAVFRQSNIHSRTGELGYYISEKYWGKGIATQAVKDITDYIFSNTDIIRIFAEPFAGNKASCRVLEKSGFSLEGILKCNAVKYAKVLDMKMYSLISPKIQPPKTN